MIFFKTCLGNKIDVRRIQEKTTLIIFMSTDLVLMVAGKSLKLHNVTLERKKLIFDGLNYFANLR